MRWKDFLWFGVISLMVNIGDVAWHVILHTPRTAICSIQNLIIVAMSVILLAVRRHDA